MVAILYVWNKIFASGWTDSKKRSMPSMYPPICIPMTQASMVKIVHAKLGNDAGILGAQVLVNEQK